MDLSIIIVNYNTLKLTLQCIESIYSETKNSSFEIIVVDNASQESSKSLRDTFPKTKLIECESNLGFGKANNIGITISTGEFILLLNSDTIIIDNALDKCVQFMKSNFALENNIGLMGCKLIYQNGSHQNSVFYKNHPYKALISSNPILNLLLGSKKNIITDAHFVAGVSGAFMFFRSEVFQKVKPFDPDIFLYSEETELCRNRVGKHFKIYYWPETTIIHLMGQSSHPEKAYMQNFLSYGFSLYKTSNTAYLFFLASLVLNLITIIILSPYFLIKNNQYELMRLRTGLSLIHYFFFKIPMMKKGWGANKSQLKIKHFSKKHG